MARIRIGRLESELTKIITRTISAKLRDKNLAFITIRNLELSNDMSYAKIFYTFIGKMNKKNVQAALEKSSGVFKSEIAKAKFMRKIPNLIFQFDDISEKTRSLDDIFEKIHAEQDKNENT